MIMNTQCFCPVSLPKIYFTYLCFPPGQAASWLVHVLCFFVENSHILQLACSHLVSAQHLTLKHAPHIHITATRPPSFVRTSATSLLLFGIGPVPITWEFCQEFGVWPKLEVPGGTNTWSWHHDHSGPILLPRPFGQCGTLCPTLPNFRHARKFNIALPEVSVTLRPG